MQESECKVAGCGGFTWFTLSLSWDGDGDGWSVRVRYLLDGVIGEKYIGARRELERELERAGDLEKDGDGSMRGREGKGNCGAEMQMHVLFYYCGTYSTAVPQRWTDVVSRARSLAWAILWPR